MDFVKLQTEYGGRFVAIVDDDKVIAAGRTYNEVLRKLEKQELLNLGNVQIRLIKKKPSGPSGE